MKGKCSSKEPQMTIKAIVVYEMASFIYRQTGDFKYRQLANKAQKEYCRQKSVELRERLEKAKKKACVWEERARREEAAKKEDKGNGCDR